MAYPEAGTSPVKLIGVIRSEPHTNHPYEKIAVLMYAYYMFVCIRSYV